MLGFAVSGTVPEGRPLRKGPMKKGDKLVLTKALGTGVLLSAGMQRSALGRHVAGALEQMQVCVAKAMQQMSSNFTPYVHDASPFRGGVSGKQSVRRACLEI